MRIWDQMFKKGSEFQALLSERGTLEDLFRNKQTSKNSIVKAKSMENDLEETYPEALACLSAGDDFRYMFKMREVLWHISNAADRITDAADIIGNIIKGV